MAAATWPAHDLLIRRKEPMELATATHPKDQQLESSASRSGITSAERAATRPGLALVLALISVPGSTLAWDLPAGGLWIGLPLAVAAIALGMRAVRRSSTGRGVALAAIVLGGLMIAQMAVWTIVSTF
jgi:hypothetical protein